MRRRACIGAIVGVAMAAAGHGAVHAVENDPLPAGGERARAVERYNEGVVHLLARRYAEAHNNLAYVLRMQGRHNFAASLAHYDRAIVLKPTLAQAYAYRGILLTQQGDLVRARQDLQRLRTLDARLAADLERVIEGGAASAVDRGGIAGQYDY